MCLPLCSLRKQEIPAQVSGGRTGRMLIKWSLSGLDTYRVFLKSAVLNETHKRNRRGSSGGEETGGSPALKRPGVAGLPAELWRGDTVTQQEPD